MKLFFYDKFWDAFLQLNKTTQKKVVDFQRKFKDNPKSAAIHLEPISTFRDPSLRTARIDDKYRAIIKAPATGDAYYLLWVDNHDEAMDWAANKLFQWNEHTQSIQVFSAPEVVEKAIDKALPGVTTTEAGLFDAWPDAQLLNIAVPEVLLPSVRKILSLNDLEKLEPYLPADAFENLFYLTDGANIELLMAEMQEGRSEAATAEEQAQSRNNQRSFVELTDDQLFNEALSGTLQKWKYYLHPSQRRLVDANFNGPVKVSGGAGTGKTVVALHRLKYLTAQSSAADKPILFTTFTKALTENLKELAQDLDIPANKIWIENIDALAFGLVRQHQLVEENARVFGLNAVKNAEDVWEEMLESELIGYDKAFLMKEYEDVVLLNNVQTFEQYLQTSRIGRSKALSRRQRKEVWDLLETLKTYKAERHYYYKEEIYNLLYNYLTAKPFHPFNACIVDELQDFSNVELRVIRAMVAEKPNDLFLVGDPLQKIYDKKINFSKVGILVRGKRSKRLRLNYRTTEEIKKAAMSILQNCTFDNFDGEAEDKSGYVSLYHGHYPQYALFKTKEEETDFIGQAIQQLMQQGYRYADVCVASRTKDGIKDIKSYLHRLKIPYFEIKGDRQGIRLLTLHGLKGLEFKHVFLTDVNDRTCPKLPAEFDQWEPAEKDTYLKSERALLYVAFTRAIENVQLTGIGQKSTLIGI